jgi:hypothetical protein
VQIVVAIAADLALAPAVYAEGTPAATVSAQQTAPTVAAADEAGEEKWVFSASVQVYVVPDEDDYAQPTITVDRGWLHLEARYNYEELDTGSVWGGYNFAGGEALAWQVTPRLGAVFGHLPGVAAGYRGSLNWWKLELYSEGEYVLDCSDISESFFYTWSEMTIAPVDWLHFGFAGQRTRADHSDRNFEPGVVVGLSFKRLEFNAYVFDPTESEPTVVLGLALSF